MDNYGKLLGECNLLGINIDVFSNGYNLHISGEKAFTKNGEYLGLNYQCVELVRRFIYKKYDINLANLWNEGNANQWFVNRDKMGLKQINKGEVTCGDIITLKGGKYGHIAIVKEIGENIVMISQNFYNDERDLKTILTRDFLNLKSTIQDQIGQTYMFESFLRIDNI